MNGFIKMSIMRGQKFKCDLRMNSTSKWAHHHHETLLCDSRKGVKLENLSNAQFSGIGAGTFWHA